MFTYRKTTSIDQPAGKAGIFESLSKFSCHRKNHYQKLKIKINIYSST